MFDERQARRDAETYRRKGLGRPARWVVEVAKAGRIEGATVLEIGGGVGAIQLELLKAGAERTVNVELSPAYEDAAAALARSAGLEGRSERRIGDAVADESIGEADIVVLHRVVCCYPDFERLLGAAARRSRRTLVFTHPPGHRLARWTVAAANLWLRLTKQEFRAYAHPPQAMEAVARAHGLEPMARRRGGIWRGVALARPRG
jgi:16S rRNA G966 N2-methylase RsmD